MVQHQQVMPDVVRISRRVILLEVCKDLALHPPEFTCRDIAGRTSFTAEATVWYCPAAGGPPLNRKITGTRAQATREAAVEQVSEEAISFLRAEMSLAIDDFNYPRGQMLRFHQECIEADSRRLVDDEMNNEAVEMVGKLEAGCVETVRALKECKELVTSGALLYEDRDVTKGLLPEFAGSGFSMEGARKVLAHVAERLESCCESASERVAMLGLGLVTDPITEK